MRPTQSAGRPEHCWVLCQHRASQSHAGHGSIDSSGSGDGRRRAGCSSCRRGRHRAGSHRVGRRQLRAPGASVARSGRAAASRTLGTSCPGRTAEQRAASRRSGGARRQDRRLPQWRASAGRRAGRRARAVRHPRPTEPSCGGHWRAALERSLPAPGSETTDSRALPSLSRLMSVVGATPGLHLVAGDHDLESSGEIPFNSVAVPDCVSRCEHAQGGSKCFHSLLEAKRPGFALTESR